MDIKSKEIIYDHILNQPEYMVIMVDHGYTPSIDYMDEFVQL